METDCGEYIPAFKYRWLTPVYDPIIMVAMREATFKRHLVRQAGVESGHRVLDIGCGTATLTILTKESHPAAEVVGLDADPQVLGIARAKASKAGVDLTLDLGMAFDLPYPDQSFDRVLSSLMFHHLTTENKHRTLAEVLRVLRPRGELHIADIGKPHNRLMHAISLLTGKLEETGDNVKGLLPVMCREVSFVNVEESARYSTAYGTLSLYRACRPA